MTEKGCRSGICRIYALRLRTILFYGFAGYFIPMSILCENIKSVLLSVMRLYH